MRVKRVVLAAFVAGMVVPGSALAAPDPIDTSQALPDIEVKGTIKPTKAQRTDAQPIASQVAWNEFGTPSSLVRPGGALGGTLSGASAVDAGRSWLDRNKALFKLSSISALQLASDSQLAASDGHAVSFMQTFGGLPASGGGLVTLGVAKVAGGWKVVSASSTINGDETLAGKPQLAPEQAWQRAASNVGEPRSLRQVHRARAAKAQLKGWKSLKVAGISDLQRTRAVAFPTVADGFVAAFENIVVDSSSGEPLAYRVFVDARSGKVLARDSLVDHATDAQAAAAATFTFNGELPAQDGGCDTTKGPYTVNAGDGVRAIDVFANADSVQNDIVLKLFNGTTEVAEADTVRTPERIRYAPAGGVPAGDYFGQLCEFQDGAPPVEPRTYTGNVTLDNSPPPAPYLARWDLFPANPPLNTAAFDPWNNPSTDTRQEWCWKASTTASDCNRVVGNLASRAPWDVDGKTGATTNTTIGNNARTAESWQDAGQPGPNQFHPVSATRDYTFPWTNSWFTSDCNVPNPQVGQSVDVSAAVTNLFTMHNRMHDWSYLLGFTEDNWNGQSSNFGLTEAFRENDPVVGDTQAGAFAGTASQRDNANMSTLPDGSSSISNMYLWQPLAGSFYAPCVDGDFDAGIIGHEYTHMIENRTIGKGSNRAGFHAGSMGEGVADLFAIEMLNEYGFVPTSDENRWAEGAYATGNKLRGIRDYAGNFPSAGAFPTPSTYPQVDPLNFSDIGFDVTGPEVHADGEIWIAMNFELRRALAAKYDAQFPESDQALQTRCADGAQPVAQCPGNRRWIQLLFDSFLLDPTAPTMVDARNSILAADQMRFGGANQNEIWGAFARRGLGQFASSTNASGRVNGVESDTNPLPDFRVPGSTGNATVHFAAVSRQAPEPAVSARIYVGHYEARVSPIADTDPATTAPAGSSANNLDDTGYFAPGTYEFAATAPGYGEVRFRRTFRAGQEQTITLHLAPNWASKSMGSTASGDSTAVTSPTSQPAGAEIQSAAQVRNNLIDDTEATDWQAAATQTGDTFAVDGKQVTVDLGGTSPQRINRVQVSALLGPVFDPNARPRPADLAQNRFTAVRQFEIQTCNSRFADCSQDDSYQRAYLSPADAFPADAPRPVAPMLLMREFTFSPVQATHVRVVVRSSQCTGGPAYQGEQDADPLNNTDCDAVPPALPAIGSPASTRFVRIAELQAFSQPSTVSVG